MAAISWLRLPIAEISPLLPTHNDSLRLGLALEWHRPCNEVPAIDDSEDDTAKVAPSGAALESAIIPGAAFGAYAMDSLLHVWIIRLRPRDPLR